MLILSRAAECRQIQCCSIGLTTYAEHLIANLNVVNASRLLSTKY